jgi:NADH-ubiquinone oxidoreductase chain 5
VPINSYKVVAKQVHESDFFISLPLFVLSICSIFIGYLTKDMFIGLGTNV